MTDVITFELTVKIKSKYPINRPYRAIQTALVGRLIGEIGTSDDQAAKIEFNHFGHDQDCQAEWSIKHTKDVGNE